MIIAIDFDGVLVKDAFPEIGAANYDIVSLVKRLCKKPNVEVILWTSRVDGALDAALKWCEKQGLEFCAVNENAPSNRAKYEHLYPNGTRKVYADYYIDDHNICYDHDKVVGFLSRIDSLRL